MTEKQGDMPGAPKVLALSGGIGGAKLDLGLYHVLDRWDLAIAVNTGDDFQHMGLMICPDLDTVMYTLSGRSDDVKGWGVSGETWACLNQLQELGSSTWFGLGDKDLAVHLHRTEQMRRGEPLGDVTADLFASFGIQAHVYPMSDQPVGTIVHTQDNRDLPFQRYFVQERCAAKVRGFTYSGVDSAQPVRQIIDLLANPELKAIILCPSNPFVSINPILALAGVRDALRNASVPVVAVSPLVGGQAVKGPLAKMLAEMNMPTGNQAIAEQYEDFLTGLVIDTSDADDADNLPVRTLATNTVMKTLQHKKALAQTVLDFAESLKGAGRS